MGRKRLGEVLLEQGAIRTAALERALARARTRGIRLGSAIRELGLVPEERLVAALGMSLGVPIADVTADDLDWTALHLLRPEYCENHDLLPFAIEDVRGRRSLRVAMADPLDVSAIDEIEFGTGYHVRPCIAGRDAIRDAIGRWLRRGHLAHGAVDDEQMVVLHAGGLQKLVESSPGGDDVAPQVGEVEVSRHLSDRAPTEKVPVLTPAHASPRHETVDDDLGYLTGGPIPGADRRLARIELRYERLVGLLARRGLLTADELSWLLE